MNFTCDFTYRHYIEVLESVRKEYKILPIRDYPKIKNEEKYILLRHDVDFSLDYALKLAEIEERNNITSTYFILLHSSFYNPLTEKNSKILKKIIDLGHEIGLHYHTDFVVNSKNDEMFQIKLEINLLENIIHEKINSLAPHAPSVFRELHSDPSKYGYLDSMNNELKKIKYISESAHFWREGCMCKHVESQNRLQILTHPIWWNENHQELNDRLEKFTKDFQEIIFSDLNDYKKMVQELMSKLKTDKSNEKNQSTK